MIAVKTKKLLVSVALVLVSSGCCSRGVAGAGILGNSNAGAAFASYALLATKNNTNRGGKGKNNTKNVKKKDKVKPSDTGSGSGSALRMMITESPQLRRSFLLWFGLNGIYSILNKKVFHSVNNYPWSVATIQMSTGFLFFAPLWLLGIRDVPHVPTVDELKNTYLPLALCHTIVHIGATAAAATAVASSSSTSRVAVSLSLAYFIKAFEPIITGGLSYRFLHPQQIFSKSVYTGLLLLTGGAALSAFNKKKFSLTLSTAILAILITVSSSVRCVFSKMILLRSSSVSATNKNKNKNSSPSPTMDVHNLYAIVTILSTCLLLPATLVLEGTGIVSALKDPDLPGLKALEQFLFCGLLLLSGLCYYGFNDAMFATLDHVQYPVSHAVGNTVKRNVFILISLITYGTPTSKSTIVGSIVALVGTYLYAREMNKNPPTAALSVDKKKKKK